MALRALHDGLPGAEQPALVAALNQTAPDDGSAWESLFIAVDGAGGPEPVLIGALWVQRLPGNTAVVWPPAPDCPALAELADAAAAWCDQHAVALAQINVAHDDAYPAETLADSGFPLLADLRYLTLDVPPAPGATDATQTSPSLNVRFHPHAADDPARLAAVIQATYVDTLDCPAIEGLRSMPEVLAGYAAQGAYRPELWYVVERAGRDAGVLILAEHAQAGNCELVYMGVVPTARGAGLGRQILARALSDARHLGSQRLVLAVDAANAPARALYDAAGFSEWDRRLAYARCRTAAS